MKIEIDYISSFKKRGKHKKQMVNWAKYFQLLYQTNKVYML